MNLPELSVRRPVTGIMFFICLTILGLFTFNRLKLDLLPDLQFPMVAILTSYEGAGPEAIEQLITRPIEGAMASVENVEEVTSTSSQGNSIVMVEFAWGTDMDHADQEVRKNLEIFALDIIPDDADRPLTFAFDPSMQPVIMLSLNAAGTPDQVRKLAEDEVEPYLARIEGVAAAEIMGGAKREIQVRLRPEWLEAHKLGPAQVVNALRMANVVIPGGQVDQGNQRLNIQTNAEFRSIADIGDVVVGQANGSVIHVRDVADVLDTFEEETTVVRADGRSAIILAVRKQSDANTAQVAERVKAELAKLQARLPAGTSLTPTMDLSLPINRSISNLASSAVLAVLITAFILLIFLRSLRTSFIVLMSIPLSMLATFAVMDFQDVTLNIISMAGLALAVGLLVDNSIVVLENIFARLGRGESIKDAAIQGTREMSMPITAGTLTTVAVFAPILFVPGIAGQLFRDLSLTIVFSLLCSLVVALTLVPLLASLLVVLGRPNRFERLVGSLTGWLDPLSERYANALKWVLNNRKKSYLGSLAIFVGCMMLWPAVGVDFMAEDDQGYLAFDVKAAPGTSLDTTRELFAEVEQIIAEKVPEAEVVVSQFGGGEGFNALFGQSSSKGQVNITLPSVADRDRSQKQIGDALFEHFSTVPGIEVTTQAPPMMGGSALQVKIYSEELERAREYGSMLRGRFEGLEGATNVTFTLESGEPELAVDVDREQARMLGLNVSDVASTISTYFLGTTATMFREAGEEYTVLVRAPRDVREDLDRLRALPVVTPSGLTVPLETVAHIRPNLGPTSITRENQRRMATISLDPAAGVPLGTLLERVNAEITANPTPDGVSLQVAGAAEDLQESFMALGLAFLVAVLLVYMVMAAQFESLLEPFVILLSIPLSLAGVVLALFLTGTTLQVTALIGLILLAGIVVNNGIVLIDVLKNRRLEGMNLIEAAMEAGRNRLRPILMTSMTTILGMIPLALELGDGAGTWAPMARTVIGGMVVSSLLALVIVPLSYVSLAGWSDRRAEKRRAKRGARAERHGEAPEGGARAAV